MSDSREYIEDELSLFFVKRTVTLPDGHVFEDGMYCKAEDSEKAIQRGWDLLPPVVVNMESGYIEKESAHEPTE